MFTLVVIPSQYNDTVRWTKAKSEIRALAKCLKARLNYYRAVYADSRTPLLAKVLLWSALGYAAMPFDIIPDFLPVVGHLDDLVVIPLLLYFALKLVPPEVLAAHRMQLLEPL
jgi:uncharacterized membrane protein YkvA (DUF1232 family)